MPFSLSGIYRNTETIQLKGIVRKLFINVSLNQMKEQTFVPFILYDGKVRE